MTEPLESPRYRIASGRPTAKWWSVFRILLVAAILPLYNVAAASRGWPALTDADGEAMVGASETLYLAVAGFVALVRAYWKRPAPADRVVTDLGTS